MRIGAKWRFVDWGHFGFLVFISTIVLAYLFDARSVSLKVNNLLLVEPAAILALILVACVLPQCFPRADADDADRIDDAEGSDDLALDQTRSRQRRELTRVGALAALLGIFSFFLETIGFDVATFLFVAIGLVICGERRSWVVAAYSTVFTVFIVYGYSLLVPYPFPMRIL